MTLPFAEPLTVRAPSPRVIPEPPRPGDPGGQPCHLCGTDSDGAIWSDEHWVLRNPGQTSLPGTVWLASRVHADSFADLPEPLARSYGVVAGRIERAILSLGDIGRVHVYRWGDGVAHFHVWFVPRPLGMLDARREMLMLWEDQLPPASAEAIACAGKRIGAALASP
jgi:diadenosine tetraphosphate (Ap4A) HIT family hydrolase